MRRQFLSMENRRSLTLRLRHACRLRGYGVRREVHHYTEGPAIPIFGRSQAVLRIDHWNDFESVTMFDVTIHGEAGERIELGS
tara:strand:- start:1200 stop:1448 length:249 start_codon:yes stop_codon:yes gene_type:complete